jgi:hypothetical protein
MISTIKHVPILLFFFNIFIEAGCCDNNSTITLHISDIESHSETSTSKTSENTIEKANTGIVSSNKSFNDCQSNISPNENDHGKWYYFRFDQLDSGDDAGMLFYAVSQTISCDDVLLNGTFFRSNRPLNKAGERART